MMAACKGHHKVVRALLATRMVDVNARWIADRRTPLAAAAYNGHPAVVELPLGEEGVNIDAPRPDKMTPLHLAAYRRRGSIIAMLIDTVSLCNRYSLPPYIIRYHSSLPFI
ncbi:ankyrin repeat domain-containing protein [Candidatus Bathyarchaeota archaeon]|nr:ankyrin repeat domain-containing protein [Candidatus Bathyarchaeota archaeon]